MNIASRYKLLVVIFAVALLTSTLLATGRTGGVCSTEDSGCIIIQKSSYSETFGIPNTYLGIFAFAVLILLTAMQLRQPSRFLENFLKLGIVVIGLFSVYFIFLQFFVIGSVCPFCMVVDTIGILSVLIYFYPKK